MKTAIIFDCEFLCLVDSPRRMWNGPQDPDPIIAQVGAVKLGLEGDFPLIENYRAHVLPINRHGKKYALDAFFTELTGITEETIAAEGRPLQEVLTGLDQFSDGAGLWSWGKDELNMMGISCFIAGIQPPIPAPRFDNVVKLVLAAGMPEEDLKKTKSSTLADYYEVQHPPLQGHDGLDDALSVAYALQHLLRTGKLTAQAFERT